MIKAKSPTGEQQLTVGKLYYDKNVKQIVYDVSFPEKEIWVQRDTVLYNRQFKNNWKTTNSCWD